MLHAKSTDRNVARIWGNDHADGQDTILLAALYHVARLDEDVSLTQIADNQFLYVSGLNDLDDPLLIASSKVRGTGSLLLPWR